MPHRILILGNSGSGKTTMARDLAQELNLPRLDLDLIAFTDTLGLRKPLPDSIALLHQFISQHPQWIIDGSYGDLIAAATPHATELRFLNPDTQACLANAKSRPFEHEKFPTPEAQNQALAFLLDWIQTYNTRPDEYGLANHQALFNAFQGPKRQYTALDQYSSS